MSAYIFSLVVSPLISDQPISTAKMPAVKREHADSESEHESARPSEPSTPPKRAKGKGGRPKSSPAKSSPSGISDGEKKMGAWSGEELKLLYAIMCPKRVS